MNVYEFNGRNILMSWKMGEFHSTRKNIEILVFWMNRGTFAPGVTSEQMQNYAKGKKYGINLFIIFLANEKC